jgi:uncharacterized membrane protein
MIKTVSFGIVHFSVAFAVVFVLTGSLVLGGLVALIEPLVNTVAYHYHEKVWNWLRAPVAVAPAVPTVGILR